MDSEAEKFRMQHAGLVARSTQGHAAKGMKIKDQEDMWVSIQHNTFKNWVNVQLRDTGLRVENLSEDLKDGLALVTLVEILQKRRLRKIKRVLNQHQALENVTTALNAIADDGIKLVNIGNVDIVNGNLKLILGLIWSLIMHYQIGQTKLPPKKTMLSWLKAVLPDCRISNFTSDWNSGVYLSALLDYCRPGLFKNWKNLNPRDCVDNCREAMDIAHREFHIPQVLEPEYLASPYLDDLSGMTYLSYFMKEGGPGYKATLDWARKQLPGKNIKNFTTDWNDGRNLATLVRNLGGPVRNYKNMPKDPNSWEHNLENCFEAGKKLGVEPIMCANDMSKPDVDHMGPMAYIAYYQWIIPRKCPCDTVKVKCDIDNVRVNNPVPFKIDFISKEVVVSEIKVQVTGPSGPVRVDVDLGSRGGKGSFVPKEVGFYELTVLNEKEPVEGSPVKIRALPDVSKIMFSGIDPCALGSIVEVLINSNGAGGGDIEVTAYSPTNRPLHCPVTEDDGVYTATFQPDEAGEWSIAVTYDEEHIQGSPFTCHVYDPNAIKVRNLDDGVQSSPGQPFTFVVDARGCGWGDAKIDVTCDGRSVPSKTLEVDRSLYEVTFTPLEPAKYKVYVYFNGQEVRGSPFPLYLGVEKPPERKSTKSKKKKSSKNKDLKDSERIIKEYSSVVDSPHMKTNHSANNTLTKTYDSSNFDSLKRSEDIDSKYNRDFQSSFTRKIENILQKNSDSSENLLNKSYNSSPTKYNSSSLTRSSPSPSNDRYGSSSLTRSILENSYKKQSYGVNDYRTDRDSPRRSSFERTSVSPVNSPRRPSFERSSTSPEHISPRRTTFDFSNSPKSDFDSHNYDASPRKIDRYSSLNRSSTEDSSFHSVFNSTSSTVIDTGVTRYHTPVTEKYSFLSDSSPKSPNYVTHSPYESPRSSPLRQTSPPANVPDSVPGLSSPSKVLLATQNAAKTTEARRVKSLHDVSEDVDENHSERKEFKEVFTSSTNGNLITRKTKSTIYKSEETLYSTPPHSPFNSLRKENYSRSLGREIYPISTTNSSHRENHTTFIPLRQENDSFSDSLRRGGHTTSSLRREHDSVSSSLRRESELLSSPTRRENGTLSNSFRRDHRPISNSTSSLNKKYISTNGHDQMLEERTITSETSSTLKDRRREALEEFNSHIKKSASNSTNNDERSFDSRISPNRYVNGNSHVRRNGIEDVKEMSNHRRIEKIYRFEKHSSDRHSPREDHYNDTTNIDVSDAVNRRLQNGVKRVDPSSVILSGAGLRLVSVGQTAEMKISASDYVDKDVLDVRVIGPSHRSVPVSLIREGPGDFFAKFIPKSVGEYVVEVKIDEEKVPGCPFRSYVYDAKEIRVGRIPDGIVGEPVEFEIDGSSAGSGNLEILVNGGHVTSFVKNLGQQRFIASFVPHSAITHSIEMKFNDREVPGSPWSVDVMEGSSPLVTVRGESIRHFPTGVLSSFDISAAGVSKEDIQINILSPAKRPVSYQLSESSEGLYRVSFVTSEVGSYIVEVIVGGQKVQGSPFIAKAYDAGLIRVSDVPNGVVGQPCQFRVDASQAGEGQLEISINDGEVPNHVQVLGGGRCLVSFTPDAAKTHTIDIKFNGETVRGCPFVCRVSDSSRVSLTLRHLELIPVGQPAAFNIAVDGGSAELTVTIRTPSHTTLPVRVAGSVRVGFTAEFTPVEVGAHTIIVNYNESTVSGTPFTCKVYDASKVGVSHLPRGAIGKSLQFIVDASEAGEGNLEISISASGRNIPTQVHPKGSARFAVSFVPLEAIDHVINISFNKEPVPGSPFVAKVQADPNRIVVSGQSLAATAVGKPSYFTISNVTGSVEDVEVSVTGHSRRQQRSF